MLNFPPQLKEVMERRYKNLEEVREPEKWRGTVSVDAKLEGDLRREARSGSFLWVCDARKEVGGRGEAPGPLQYFISGLSLCQLIHYAERSSVLGIHLESVDISVKAQLDARPGGTFDEIAWETRIVSPEGEERIRELAVLAEHDCYATNTLAKAARLTGSIILNGKQIMTTRYG